MAKFTLDDIFASGFIEPVAPPRPAATPTSRLGSEFEAICQFHDRHGRPPGMNGVSERQLAMALDAIRSNPAHRETLALQDRHSLLSDSVPRKAVAPRSLDDILDSPDAAFLGADTQSIFTVRSQLLPKAATDYTAERKPCEAFAAYRDLFIQCDEDVVAGRRSYRPFQRDLRIQVGDFFVLNGIRVYVAEINDPHKRGRNMRRDARLRCIFENGTESDMLMHSLRRQLIEDPLGRRISTPDAGVLFGDKAGKIKTGTVYVLRSLSVAEGIAERKDLYKIGITKGTVRDRITKAETDPTYLMAPVHPLQEYDFFDADHRRAERLLHRFFGEACLKVEITGNDGKIHRPREWFIAPLDVVSEAVTRLIDGTIGDYRYDEVSRKIVAYE